MAAGLLLACTGSLVAGPAPPAPEVVLKDLPDLQFEHYRVDPYIKAAAALQAMGKEKACKWLTELARQEQKKYPAHRVIVLCRMLFTAKPDGKFRRPYVGAADFLGGTDYGDWPLEPIEVVDGVPFLITQGYELGGFPEPPTSYLAHCLDRCDWGSVKYTTKTPDEKGKALKKLISSRKWKKALTDEEKDFLTRQIK
jgi:hypothetical protein